MQIRRVQKFRVTFTRLRGQANSKLARSSLHRIGLVLHRAFTSSALRPIFGRNREPPQNMNWSASVLSTVSSDTEPTIVITFDTAKYIFNAGENTNRAFLQSRSNWKRTKGIFLTRAETQRAAGLPGKSLSLPNSSILHLPIGILMTFADSTISYLDIVGPPGTRHLLATMRWYTYRCAQNSISYLCSSHLL
jgi:hypothetical protein